MEKEFFGSPVLKKILQILMILSILLLTAIFMLSGKFCIAMAALGNVFFLLWLVFGDPLNSGIKIRIIERSFIEFLLCAVLIWSFAVIFNMKGMCSTLADLTRVLSKYLGTGP